MHIPRRQEGRHKCANYSLLKASSNFREAKVIRIPVFSSADGCVAGVTEHLGEVLADPGADAGAHVAARRLGGGRHAGHPHHGDLNCLDTGWSVE